MEGKAIVKAYGQVGHLRRMELIYIDIFKHSEHVPGEVLNEFTEILKAHNDGVMTLIAASEDGNKGVAGMLAKRLKEIREIVQNLLPARDGSDGVIFSVCLSYQSILNYLKDWQERRASEGAGDTQTTPVVAVTKPRQNARQSARQKAKIEGLLKGKKKQFLAIKGPHKIVWKPLKVKNSEKTYKYYFLDVTA